MTGFKIGTSANFILVALLLLQSIGFSSEYLGNINQDWAFLKADATGAEAVDFDDRGWGSLQLPHTWTADEATSDSYYRGVGWYRKTLKWGGGVWNQSLASEKRVYLRFGAAALMCNVYVNGILQLPDGLKNHRGDSYTHKGGYSAFTLDITDSVQLGRDIVIAVRVRGDADWQTIAPLGMDFTIQCGLYRNVDLFYTEDLRIDRTNHGSRGIFITPIKQALTSEGILAEPNNEKWEINVRGALVNSGSLSQDVTVEVSFSEKAFEGIRLGEQLSDEAYDVIEIGEEGNPMRFSPVAHHSSHAKYKYEFEPVTVLAGESLRFNDVFTIDDPRLWNGQTDPSLYNAVIRLKVNGRTVDTISDTVGFRYFRVDEEKGFFLNGKPYPLHGIARHQDFGQSVGVAVTQFEQDVDFSMIYETGATAVRLSHYQHDEYFYELCDKYGIVVWAEIPLGGHMGTSESRSGTDYYGDPVTEEFMKTTKHQLSDLIYQQYNSPSICVWGLQNEVNDKYYDTMEKFIAELNLLAHQLDPVRLTTQAICFESMLGWETDILAWNTYPQWYFDITMGEFIAEKKEAMETTDKYDQYAGMAISEYGAGGSPFHHEIPPRRPITTGEWHPEEWQSYVHESALVAFSKQEHLWATFLWCMFDFAASGRSEGSFMNQNDKGLVTRDRGIKKDAFYLYKSNWNKDYIFTHIASSRYKTRHSEKTRVKVYSNCDEVILYQKSANNMSQLVGEMESIGCGIFVLDEVKLDLGSNEFFAIGKYEGEKYQSNPVTWVREEDTNTAVSSLDPVLAVDEEKMMIIMYNRRSIDRAEALSILETDSAVATMELVSEGGSTVSASAAVLPGMKLVVQSEDPAVTAEYTFGYANISAGRASRGSSTQQGGAIENVLDANPATKWRSESVGWQTPQWIEVDLGRVYQLTDAKIDWDTHFGTRYYFYQIYTSLDGDQYTQAIDKSSFTVDLDKKSEGLVTIDEMEMTAARYVRIKITGCSVPVQYASIRDIELHGWQLVSQDFVSPKLGVEVKAFEIKHKEKQIYVSWDRKEYFDRGDFIAGLQIIGNASYELEAAAFYITEGDSVVVKDHTGKEIRYTIHIK
ncbi:glycoside hydrolase family 2 protein [Coraliomargarita sp. W4R53]